MRRKRDFIMIIIVLATCVVCNNGVVRSEEPLIPAFPVAHQHNKTCHLDLSDELFGGVKEACGQGKSLDRNRCCPVLAAWLYAAHAKTALQTAVSPISDDTPVLPDDSLPCVNTLQDSLNSRGIRIPRPNATCDAIICFCGIRLHQLTSLTCPSALNFSVPHHNITMQMHTHTHISVLQALEFNCTDPSYQGCTRCLKTLDKLKGKEEGSSSDRRTKMYSRDCELMGLTWLLAMNKTAYIPTVSAVLRALMYSIHPPRQSECSPDKQNMPLAVDSAELYQSSSAAFATPSVVGSHLIAFCSTGISLLLLILNRF